MSKLMELMDAWLAKSNPEQNFLPADLVLISEMINAKSISLLALNKHHFSPRFLQVLEEIEPQSQVEETPAPEKISAEFINALFGTTTCRTCGKVFARNNYGQRYCSLLCRKNKNTEEVKEITIRMDLFLSPAPDNSKSYYQQRMEEKAREKELANQLSAMNTYSKLDFSNLHKEYIPD